MKNFKIFFKKVLTFFFELFVDPILYLSVLLYKRSIKKKFNLKYLICIQDVNTYGDAIIFYEYSRLKSLEKKKKLLIIAPNTNKNIYLLNFFFKKKNYIIYSQLIFNLLYFFLKKIDTKNLLIILNHKLLKNLKKVFHSISFYAEYNFKNDEIFHQNKIFFKKDFLKKYLKIRNSDNTSEAIIDFVNLQKKYGFNNIKRIHSYSVNKVNKLFSKLRIKKNKYICLCMRPYEDKFINKKIDFEHDPRATLNFKSYLRIIKYLNKLGYKIVLMGDYNKSMSYFDNHNVINYRNSDLQTVENDMILSAFCKFVISNGGGYAVVPRLFNKPTFVVNFAYFLFYHFDNYVFYPKIIFDKSKKRKLFLKEILNSPIFFEMGNEEYIKSNLISMDISEIDFLNSIKSFIKNLYKKKPINNSLEKLELKKLINPMHLNFNLGYKLLSDIYIKKNL
jgi:putative glycosyltransferase (TIGR04372 family)